MKKRGKRGQEAIMLNLIYIGIAIIILVLIFFFISDIASGKLVKSQILAKEISLFLDEAEPGTSIMIEHEKAEIKIDEEKGEVAVKIGHNEEMFTFFTKYDIEFETNSTFTKITIS